MASFPSDAALLVLLLASLTPPLPASSVLVLEEGYAVSTVVDFNKVLPDAAAAAAAVHPFSLLPRPRSQDLLLLDSAGSAFYSVPLSGAEGEIKPFSGAGVAGFADGNPATAMFNRPRSFAVDSMDNVYVADRLNSAVRKISRSGFTTTIAGGYSGKTGHIDGPAQNASFSNDFELVYVSKMCALLIADRGNRLIRRVDLKAEDCVHGSQSGLGMASVSVVALLCVLLGSVVGFVARSFLCLHTGSLHQPLCQQDMEALPSGPSHSGEDRSDELIRHQKRSC